MDVQINNKGDQGYQIGENPTTDKIGVFGKTPVVQPVGAAQAALTPAVVTAPTALTDNGGGTADNTVESMAAPAAFVADNGGGTADGTVEVINVPDLSSWDGTTVFPSAAQATAIDAAITAAKNDIKECTTKIASLITLMTVIQDNFKELTTAQAANRAAIVSLAAGLGAAETLSNAQRLALVNTGWIKGAA